jgi:hypothetical protein
MSRGKSSHGCVPKGGPGEILERTTKGVSGSWAFLASWDRYWSEFEAHIINIFKTVRRAKMSSLRVLLLLQLVQALLFHSTPFLAFSLSDLVECLRPFEAGMRRINIVKARFVNCFKTLVIWIKFEVFSLARIHHKQV